MVLVSKRGALALVVSPPRCETTRCGSDPRVAVASSLALLHAVCDQSNHDLAPGARSLAFAHPRPQGLPLDELHGQEHPALVGTNVVNGDDVGVVEPRERLCFALQAGIRLCPPSVATQQLDRHPTIELGVVGREHDPHRTRSQAREHEITAHELPRHGIGCGFIVTIGHRTVALRRERRVQRHFAWPAHGSAHGTAPSARSRGPEENQPQMTQRARASSSVIIVEMAVVVVAATAPALARAPRAD